MTIPDERQHFRLSADDLLQGSQVTHEIKIPPAILTLAEEAHADSATVLLRPLSMGTLTLISRAAHDDLSLIPLLTIKESLVDPTLSLEQVRSLNVGLVHYLVQQINLVSGLTADGEVNDGAATSPQTQGYVLLAKHFGWTPEQVSQLTPGQVAIYLAGVQQLLNLEKGVSHESSGIPATAENRTKHG